ncbi:MAG: UDP-N-acetylmuramoyl-L-alanyl-D-glutamate--2,6-diaminopimelate ligase, partial [bacterium]|nr:UDP-N-acetylmuramoyl-L-alanyl-D-glutamate--2,6-diaminopimelate ligase [bacterium]
MKRTLKKFLPENFVLSFHYITAWVSALWYGFPSREMKVIGVTGTKGKTSTANFIWACLSAGGIKTGIITTANIRIGDKERLNAYHMTMPGRFLIQKIMREMVRAGCTYCVIETTSEGIKQSRHIGIKYDISVFTNLSPEHLESHGGSFEEYKKMKGKLFAAVKTIIANSDDAHSEFFLSFPALQNISFGILNDVNVRAENIQDTARGVDFSIKEKIFHLNILGKFNVYNALPAIIISRLAGVPDTAIAKGLSELHKIPGRMEIIDEGQKFLAIVDYAHEKVSMAAALGTARAIAVNGAKVIVLLGAEGGGRDKAKRPQMGEIAAKMADYVVVSNVDPYDDEPIEILEDIAVSAERFGKIRGENLFAIEDRREGNRKALSLTREGDVVLITGKGAEQSMIIGGANIPWDDRV